MADVEQNLVALRAAFAKTPVDVDVCNALVAKLKIGLTSFQLIPPFTEDEATVRKHLLWARETLELAALVAVGAQDLSGFTRQLTQLHTYYHDYAALLDPSERRFMILGLHLMSLLAHNRIAEFHTQLEQFSVEEQQNMYIAYPVTLEQRLMEGIYNKIVSARALAPTPAYSAFVDTLVGTVQTKIADCIERAYDSMSVADAKTQLGVDSDAALETLCQEREWTLSADNEKQQRRVMFTHSSGPDFSLPSHKVIKEYLGYATELERIV